MGTGDLEGRRFVHPVEVLALRASGCGYAVVAVLQGDLEGKVHDYLLPLLHLLKRDSLYGRARREQLPGDSWCVPVRFYLRWAPSLEELSGPFVHGPGLLRVPLVKLQHVAEIRPIELALLPLGL